MNLLLVVTHEYLGLNALQCLHSRADKIYILGTQNAFPLKFSKHCVDFILCNNADIENPGKAIIRDIRKICRQKNIDVILSPDLPGVLFLSKIKNTFSGVKIFPIDHTKKLEALHNKWKFCQILKNGRFPYPRTHLIKKKKDLAKIRINFPAVLKPLNLQGGQGVKIVRSLREAVDYLSKKSRYNDLPLLLQEFLDGYDIGVNVLAVRGTVVALCMQKMLPDKSLFFYNDKKIIKMIERLIRKCRYTGMAHIDMFTHGRSDEPNILEFNPRAWGSILGSKFAGVNFLRLGVSISGGGANVQNKPKEVLYVSTRNFLQNFSKSTTGQEKNFKKLKNSDFFEMLSDPLPYVLCAIQEITK